MRGLGPILGYPGYRHIRAYTASQKSVYTFRWLIHKQNPHNDIVCTFVCQGHINLMQYQEQGVSPWYCQPRPFEPQDDTETKYTREIS